MSLHLHAFKKNVLYNTSGREVVPSIKPIIIIAIIAILFSGLIFGIAIVYKKKQGFRNNKRTFHYGLPHEKTHK
jgi:hypothetical protein